MLLSFSEQAPNIFAITLLQLLLSVVLAGVIWDTHYTLPYIVLTKFRKHALHWINWKAEQSILEFSFGSESGGDSLAAVE